MTEKTLTLKAQGVGFDTVRADVRALFAEVRRGLGEVNNLGKTRVNLTRKQHKDLIKIERDSAKSMRRIAKAAEQSARTDKKRLQAEAKRHAQRMAAIDKAAKKAEKRAADQAAKARLAAEDRANRAIAAKRKKAVDKLGGLIVGVGSVAGAQKAFSAAREGAKIIALEAVFERAGKTQKDLQDIIEASGSTLTRKTALQLSNSAQLFNINQKAVVRFARIAKAASDSTGRSIEHMFESIVLGTARTSPKILDNLGIIVKQKQVYEEHAAVLGTTVDMLTETQKRQAFLNATMKAGGDIIKKAPLNPLNTGLERMAANVANVKAEFDKLLATKFVGPIADAITGKFTTNEGSKQTQTLVHYYKLKGALTLIEKSATNTLPKLELLNVAFDHLATQDRPDNNLDTRFRAAEIRAKAIAQLRQQIALVGKKVEADKANAALQRRLNKLRKEDEAAAKAIDEENAIKNKKTDEAIKKKLAAAKRAAAKAQRERAAFLKSLGKTNLDIIGSVAKLVAYGDKDGGLEQQLAEATERRHKAVFDLADAANKKLLEQNTERIEFLQQEIDMLDKILDKRDDLTLKGRVKLIRQRDNKIADLAIAEAGTNDPEKQAKAIVKKKNQIAKERVEKKENEGKAEAGKGGAVALVGENDADKLRGIKDSIHENITVPLTIASETANSFGSAMADSAAAAIIEGKSFKKATNSVLKDLARRALSNSIFYAAAAAASAALGDIKGATLNLKASGTYALVAGATLVGAAATGGVRDSAPNKRDSASAGRLDNKAIGGRTEGSGQLVRNYYISLSAPVNTPGTIRALFDLINSGANTPGSPQINLSAIEGNPQRFQGAS